MKLWQKHEEIPPQAKHAISLCAIGGVIEFLWLSEVAGLYTWILGQLYWSWPWQQRWGGEPDEKRRRRRLITVSTDPGMPAWSVGGHWVGVQQALNRPHWPKVSYESMAWAQAVTSNVWTGRYFHGIDFLSVLTLKPVWSFFTQPSQLMRKITSNCIKS